MIAVTKQRRDRLIQPREYVITRPDTPAPWANYLGSPEYGALVSNNAGGYSFAKSGANG